MSNVISHASSSLLKPHFASLKIHPFDEIDWEFRDVRIEGANGEVIFEQPEVEIPSYFSETATRIVASK
ncbi:MAG: hypothetical protein KJT03_05030, partial [Verrucomicrobiae bacterium]|nr:hypothetical protein [Verrucomicrobiae bacterium]